VGTIGFRRVVWPAGVLPQAAERLDASPEIGPDEDRVRVERLNLDAASYRQPISVRALFDARLAAD